MGYTHYFYVEEKLDKKTFKKVAADFVKLLLPLEHLGVPLAGPDGKGKPIITQKEIAFNGVEKCGHQEKDLGITWPAKEAKGVADLKHQHINGNQTLADTDGTWFAGLHLSTRTCGGDCSHEAFVLETKFAQGYEGQKPQGRVAYRDANGKEVLNDPKTIGKYFEFTKTAYKPYDLAVTAIGIIAKHHFGEKVIIHSDGEMKDWKDAMEICDHFLGYGKDFKLDDSEEKSS